MPHKIPDYTKRAIDRYVVQHIPTGSFLKAVLSNDLIETIARGDSENLLQLPEIVRYLWNNVPQGCWGSKENYEKWIGR